MASADELMAQAELISKAARLAREERARRAEADALLEQRDDAMLAAVEAGASIYSLMEPLGFASRKTADFAVRRARKRRDASALT